jgi:two-component system alkaline phosphatase synthesis response regulator PhoP
MPSNRPKLLIVEDEPGVLELLVWIVRPFHYELATALNGEEAVAVAAKFQPDCALLNYIMPKMNGLKAAVEIRQRFPKCKFVFFTGNYWNESFREEYRRLGFREDLLLGKPFKVVGILRLLARAGFPPRPIYDAEKLQKLMAELEEAK